MKAETVIVLIVLIVTGLVTGIFFYFYSPAARNIDVEPAQAAEDIQIVDNRFSNLTRFVTMGQNVCEGCHLSGKKLAPQAYEVKQHVNGVGYCLKCHKINHTRHPINQNVTCARCHGSENPKRPTSENGTQVCGGCHNKPDPLKPSNGNLIVIHRPRNVDCVRCHIDVTNSCLKCHNEIKDDKKWIKRLTHFRTLLLVAK